MKFGENLRKFRKFKKLSQEDLAEKMGVSRQSVSKWETGDAYPEMNNILELCKIFHCNINDLVNDSLADVDSLDEEVKMNVVKFQDAQQKKMKILSKSISIIAKIGKIVTLVCIPIIIASMIAIGFALSKLTIIDDEISFEGDDTKINVVEENDRLFLKMDDMILIEATDRTEIDAFKLFLKNNSKTMNTIYIETGLLFLIAILVITSIMLKSIENLFNNINKGDTPFTLENVRYIKKVAYLMIAVTLLPSIGGGIFEWIMHADLEVEFELFNLVEILFLFSIAYIFQYGYEIQLDSKGKMYGSLDE